MAVITKEFTVDLAHIVETQFLPEGFECKCRNIHGHTVTIIPKIKGEINPKTRMVLDYTLLSQFKKFLDVFLDHCLILPEETKFPYHELLNIYNKFYNEVFGEDYQYRAVFRDVKGEIIAHRVNTITLLKTPSTTAEDMSQYLTEVLKNILIENKKLFDLSGTYCLTVVFKETPKTSAICSPIYVEL